MSSTATLNKTAKHELRDLYALLKQFNTQFKSHLHPGAQEALDNFICAADADMEFQGSGSTSAEGVFHMACRLSTVRAQVDYFLTDKNARARRAVDRAFTHLQRSLVADVDIQTKWMRALQEARAEEACEKLGAVHMLLHSIWAFKANSTGGKTDLVLGQALIEREAAQVADAMVLTEWKVVRAGDAPIKKAREAHVQAERYSGETLAGFELATYRYLVLVSTDFLIPTPTIPSQQGITYEVRNIAIQPSSPSAMAAKAASAT
ncbi:hypothetical protein [Myxococcus xanthus]|uniref:hypothetical protein n=1 Tax=Myxococcus xanthus TaxID=34 RepID=UPI001F311FD7|nr:hypothetical protein [Myxococcus xanthus]